MFRTRNLVAAVAGCGGALTAGWAEPLQEVILNHQSPPPALAALRAKLAPYVHREFNEGVAEAITDDVLHHYQAQDFPVVQVSLADDAFQQGRLQVEVSEGRIGEVTFSGGQHLAPVVTRLISGDILRGVQLQAELDWLNRNPFREATVAATPGATPDLAKLDIASSDRWPIAVWTAYSNDGIHPLGGNRWLAGASVGDLLHWDQTLTLQEQTADDYQQYHALMGEWRLRLPWRHELTLSGASVETSSPLMGGLNVDSSAWFASLRYRIPWRSSLTWKGEHWFGVDQKHFSTEVLFGGGDDLFHPLTLTTLTLGTQATFTRVRDTLELASEAVWSPGEWLGASDDAAFSAVSPGTAAAFFSVRGHVIWEHAWRNRWSLLTQVYGQWADGELLSSEAFYLTGASAVRGYEERSILGAKGVRATLEARSPFFATSGLPLQTQGVAFVDAGHTWTDSPLTDTPVALGLGFRAQLGHWGQVRCEGAWPLTDGLAPRLHLQISVTF